MRVVYLLQDTGSIYGAERATLDLLQGFSRRSEVQASALLIKELRITSKSNEFADALRQTCPCAVLPTRLPFSLPLIKSIRKRLRETDADCLHTVGYKATVHGGCAAGFGRLNEARLDALVAEAQR
jgi:hypothetical protein